MTEYPQHMKAKQRIFELLLKQARFTTVAMEAKLPFGRKGYSYVADVYAISHVPDGKLVIEIDGKQGHHSKRAVQLDKKRDAECEKRGIAVVRFLTRDIVGKKKINDWEIMEELDFHLHHG